LHSQHAPPPTPIIAPPLETQPPAQIIAPLARKGDIATLLKVTQSNDGTISLLMEIQERLKNHRVQLEQQLDIQQRLDLEEQKCLELEEKESKCLFEHI